MSSPVLALGLMSGTSLDGVDIALISTDGIALSQLKECLTIPYSPEVQEQLRLACQGKGDFLHLEQHLTQLHIEAVSTFLHQYHLSAQEIAVIGFHGQTIQHRPHEKLTWQLGNGALMACTLNIPVVCDFRRHDMACQGQGAPLVPIFHLALAEKFSWSLPIAILNIGGIANVSWIDEGGTSTLTASDIGPGNALLNDWIWQHRQEPCDWNGNIASQGKVHQKILEEFLNHPFFAEPIPKALDRHSFTLEKVQSLSLEDGAATLTAFTAHSIAKSQSWFPSPPKSWLVGGGGRHNKTLMNMLSQILDSPIAPIDTVPGIQGDAIEAQAFAFLAVRSLKGLPLTFPGTTGVSRPVTGGAFYRP